MAKLRLGIYAAAHFLVDLGCALLLLGRICPDWDPGMAILLYNLFAFAVQMPVGLLADRLGRCHLFASAGCLLVLLGWMLPPGPTAVITAGLGNAAFHVGGGLNTLNEGGRRAGPLGLFVSPGAFGVYLGGYPGVIHASRGGFHARGGFGVYRGFFVPGCLSFFDCCSCCPLAVWQGSGQRALSFVPGRLQAVECSSEPAGGGNFPFSAGAGGESALEDGFRLAGGLRRSRREGSGRLSGGQVRHVSHSDGKPVPVGNLFFGWKPSGGRPGGAFSVQHDYAADTLGHGEAVSWHEGLFFRAADLRIVSGVSAGLFWMGQP